VADLTSARTEGQLARTLDQILAQLPIEGEAHQREAEVGPLVEMGEQVLAEGDAARAANIFRQIVDMAPEHAEALSGLARALTAAGELDEARTLLAGLPEKVDKDSAIARARSALALAEIAPAGDAGEYERRVAANPDDLEARFELAGALMSRGARDEAADQLLEIIRRDREWNEGAARARLLQLLEATGLEDPWAAAQRRRLSDILFG
jgi:putative thioredoxin